MGGIGTIEDQHDILRDRGPAALSPLAIPLMMANAASGVVAMHHGLRGECYGTVSACAAGAHAVGTGMRLVRGGVLDACLVGGAEAGITPLAAGCFEGMGATSESGICRPFDRRRDGFILGEGAGALVLEDEQLARERGARILGWIEGYAATADAHHLTAPHPEGEGSGRAISKALADAGWEGSDLDYVNAHGTSTPLNDRSETMALKLALGEQAERFRSPRPSPRSATCWVLPGPLKPWPRWARSTPARFRPTWATRSPTPSSTSTTSRPSRGPSPAPAGHRGRSPTRSASAATTP